MLDFNILKKSTDVPIVGRSTAKFGGNLGVRRIRPIGLARPMTEERIRELGFPALDLDRRVNEWREANRSSIEEAINDSRNLYSYAGRLPDRYLVFESRLMLSLCYRSGEELWLGLASTRVITTVGVAFLVDAWQNSVELENMKYHGIGTGSTAAAIGDTDIETELTTQYQSDNTRATGSLTEGATGNIFRTVGTNTVDASAAITEQGVLDNATVGSGTLWDRHVFSAVNLSNGDSLQSTYDMTASSGG